MDTKIGITGPEELIEAFQKKLLRDTECYWVWGPKEYRHGKLALQIESGISGYQPGLLTASDTSTEVDSDCDRVFDLPSCWNIAVVAVEEMLNPPPPTFEELPSGTVYVVDYLGSEYTLLKVGGNTSERPASPVALLCNGELVHHHSSLKRKAPIKRVLGKLSGFTVDVDGV